MSLRSVIIDESLFALFRHLGACMDRFQKDWDLAQRGRRVSSEHSQEAAWGAGAQ